jgi:hypothetical protein
MDLPKCPDCGSPIEYAKVNLVRPFNCPTCGNLLFVNEKYYKTISRVCYALTAVPCLLLCLYKGFVYVLLLPVLFLLLTMVALIFVKRIVPPVIEDYSEDSKKARYQPL